MNVASITARQSTRDWRVRAIRLPDWTRITHFDFHIGTTDIPGAMSKLVGQFLHRK